MALAIWSKNDAAMFLTAAATSLLLLCISRRSLSACPRTLWLALPAGIILTGGGAHMAGMVELTRDVLALPVRPGIPERGITGLMDSVHAPRYAVPVGLALWAARQRLHGAGSGASVDRLIGPVRRWLQDFF